ncbi:hypothetical protein BASA82_001024 [Batrachochytrium salamandrivorans]|nr:hypothetical protein BASA82_001024 [Batrachochytrium salamandrivorans]
MICARHIAKTKSLLLMLQETNLDTNAFRFTAPKYSSSSTQPADLASVGSWVSRSTGVDCWVYIPGQKTDRQATLKLVERALELATRDHNRPVIVGGDWNAPHSTLQRKVSSWGFGLHVVSFSGSKATFRGHTATARWSSY